MGIFIPEEYDSTLDFFSIQDEGSKSLQWDYKKEEYSEFEKYSTSELESMLDKQENAYIEYLVGDTNRELDVRKMRRKLLHILSLLL